MQLMLHMLVSTVDSNKLMQVDYSIITDLVEEIIDDIRTKMRNDIDANQFDHAEDEMFGRISDVVIDIIDKLEKNKYPIHRFR